MATPNRFTVYLGGVLIATAWSLHAANEKLTAGVFARAYERGEFPAEGQIFNSQGLLVKARYFQGFSDSEGYDSDDAFADFEDTVFTNLESHDE